MPKILPNNVPGKVWKGGYIHKYPDLKYNYDVADLTTLAFNNKLDNIHSIGCQHHALCPKCTGLKVKCDLSSRCVQLFIQNISGACYDISEQKRVVNRPQQDINITGFGTLNVEITCVKQRGQVINKYHKSAIEIVGKPQKCFISDSNESVFGKILLGVITDLNKFHHLHF